MNLSRRSFLAGCGLLLGGGTGFLTSQLAGSVPVALRPPGAKRGKAFLGACIRCGQCVEACPYDSLELFGIGGGLAAGTPFVEARKTPCYLCTHEDELKCISVCPSGALEPVEKRSEVRMGTAVIDRKTCFAYNGVTCRVCWRVCPFQGTALVYDKRMRPTIDPKACVGCGICEEACITEESSIVVRPADANGGRDE